MNQYYYYHAMISPSGSNNHVTRTVGFKISRQMIASFLRHLCTHGIWRTLVAIFSYISYSIQNWIDGGFDREYGTDTGGIIDDMQQLGVDNQHKDNAFGYQGIQLAVFRRIMSDLPLNPQDYIFIDFGSGKGRAVMMAARRKFSSVHGVEFSPVLHDIARSNIELFNRQCASASPITLHCQDAADFHIPDGDLVCFFYNPFDHNVMAKVLDNIATAYARFPKRIFIAYRNAVCVTVFDSYPFLKQVRVNETYRIFSSQQQRDC